LAVNVSSARPSGAKYAAKKSAILAAATRVLNDQGTRGFTLAEVARRMNMHPVSLTYYFRTRELLASECLLTTIARFGQMAEQASLAATARERISAFIAAYFDVRRQVALGEQAPLASFSELRLIDRSADSPVIVAFIAMMKQVRALFPHEAPGQVRAIQARLMMEHLSWTRVWIDRYEPAELTAAGQRLADIFIGGLSARGSTWPQTRPFALGSAPTSEITRERYLVAATELINRLGFDGASVDLIASSLNVTKGSFYHHNAAKEQLLVDCFDRTFTLFRQAQALATGARAWDRLASMTRALVRYQQSGENGRLLRNYAMAALPAKARPLVIARYQELAGRIATLIGEGISDGSIRPVDPLLAAHVVIGLVNASSYLESWVRGVEDLDLSEALARPGLMGVGF